MPTACLSERRWYSVKCNSFLMRSGVPVSPSGEKTMQPTPYLCPLASDETQRPLESSKTVTSGALPPCSPAATKPPHLCIVLYMHSFA